MTDPVTAFLLGPVYFLPRLLTIGTGSSLEPAIFLASGVGTAFWVALLSAIAGIVS